MSTRLHLALGIAVEATGMIVALILFVRFVFSSQISGFLQVVIFLAAAVAGMALPRAVFRGLVRARCGQCGGRAVRRDGRPITYVCRSCGHVHDTGVRDRGPKVWPPR
jgi:hypothetical protein